MSTPGPKKSRRLTAWIWRTPLLVTLLYVVIAVAAEDSFYPFSHFPMYSYVTSSRHYLMVADGEGKPIPVARLTGLTPGMIAKRYRNYGEVEARKLGVRNVDISEDSMRVIWVRLFKQLRDEAHRLKEKLPEKMQVIRFDITFEDGHLVEQPSLVASE